MIPASQLSYKSFKLVAVLSLFLFAACQKEEEKDPTIPSGSSYNENIIWRNIVGSTQDEKVNHGLVDNQGNLLAISFPSSGPYLVKLDGESGNEIWNSQLSTNYGIPYGSAFIDEEGEIDYLVCGGTDGSQEPWMARIDGDNGSVLWIKTYDYESSGYDGFRKVLVASDGFIYTTGFVEANDKASFFASEGGQLLAAKIDPVDGQLIWLNTYNDADCGYNIQEYDNQLFVGAFQYSEGWKLLQISSFTGGLISRFAVPNTSDIIPSDFCISEQGDFLFGGHIARSGSGDPFDYTLSFVDQSKNITWTKCYGNPRGYSENYIRNELYGIQCKNNKVYLFGGSGDESRFYGKTNDPFPSSSTWVAWVLQCDLSGNIEQSSCFNHDEKSGGNTACEYGVVDGSYLYIFNDTDANYEVGQSDIGVMKIALP